LLDNEYLIRNGFLTGIGEEKKNIIEVVYAAFE
jgi:hypothetical protein